MMVRSRTSRCAGEFRAGVAVEEVVGLKILDLVALQDRLIGNRLGDVRLPGARFANKQSVLASGNERQGVELEAGLTWQFGIEGPVELGERQLFVEPGLLVSPLDKTGLTTVQFILQDKGEGLEEGRAGPANSDSSLSGFSA
ncbi:hypothetical protein ACVJGB_003358 [Bradyrhizobium liaoningense]